MRHVIARTIRSHACAAVVAVAALLAAPRPSAGQGGAPLWPLVAGQRLEWCGDVAWTIPGTRDTLHRPAQWTSTVHVAAVGAGRLVAVVEGLPQAILQSRGEMQPRWSVVASDAQHVWLRESATREAADSTAAAWRAGARLMDDVLLLRLPAQVGDRWPDQAMKVADGFFEWTVTHVADVVPSIPGARPAAGARAWEVTMHTAPEMRVVTLVPGLGVVRWWHLHFGRTQRVLLELVAVRPMRGVVQGRRR